MVDYYTLNQVNKSIFGISEAKNDIDMGTALTVDSILTGGFQQYQGYQMEAGNYNNAALLTGQINQFNQDVASYNTISSINQLSRKYHDVVGQQLNQQAATGISIGSKTSVMLREHTLANFQSQIQQTIVNAENQRRQTTFEAQSQQYQLGVQAQNSMLKGSYATINAAQKAAEVQFSGEIQKRKLDRTLDQIYPTLLSNLQTNGDSY